MKYWAYINNEIKGPFEKEELVKIEGFNKDTLICPQSPVDEETKEWKEAFQFPEVFQLLELDKTKESSLNDSSKVESIEIPQSSVLETNNKTDVIIERFDVNKVFNLNTEINKVEGSSLDPLTLSQIRRKQEDLAPSQSEQLNIEPEKKVEEYTGKIEEFNEKPKEFAIGGIELESGSKLKDDNVDNKDDEEKKESNKIDFSFDKEEFKKEILYEIEKRISSYINKNDFEVFKDEIKNYIDVKFSELNKGDSSLNAFSRDVNDIVKHLEIDVKDMRVRLESVEKKLDYSFRSMSINKNTESKDSQKTVVIQKENDDKKDLPSKKSPLKVIGIIILVIVVIGSILFFLNQFGILNFNKNKSQVENQPSNDIFSTSIETVTTSSNISTGSISLSSNQTVSVSAPNIVSSTQSISVSESEMQGNLDNTKDLTSNNDEIIEKVKNYRLNNNLTLEQTINEILKYRKIKNRKINWNVTENNDLYRVDAVIETKPKNIVFRFDFDEKNMFLKPLNTLSQNALKMMMQKNSDNKDDNLEKVNKKKNKKTFKSNKDLNKSSNSKNLFKPSIKDNEQNKNSKNKEENQQSLSDNYEDASESSKNSENSDEGGYLIIGE
jgi:hypothetical protein